MAGFRRRNQKATLYACIIFLACPFLDYIAHLGLRRG